MHALFVELLVLCSALLVLDAGLRKDVRGDLVADVGRFGNEEDDADTEYAEEDRTDAELALLLVRCFCLGSW